MDKMMLAMSDPSPEAERGAMFEDFLEKRRIKNFDKLPPLTKMEVIRDFDEFLDSLEPPSFADGGRVKLQAGSAGFGDVTTQVSVPAPFIESAGKVFLTGLEKVLAPGAAVDTTKFRPQVADQNILQQQALQQAATSAGLGQLTFGGLEGTVSGIGAGTGVASFEPFVAESQRLAGIDPATGQTTAAGLQAARDPFMTPFQQQVIDATKASFEQQRARDRSMISDAAVRAGAFGGARQGVQEGVYDAETALGLAGLEAQLRQQGFAQADAARVAALQNQQGMAQAVPQLETQQLTQLSQLGAGQQAIQQAQLDAAAAAAREAAYEQQQRQGFFGQQIAPFTGGFGAQQQFSTTTQPPPSTLNTILGVGTMAGGLLGGIGQFLGGRTA